MKLKKAREDVEGLRQAFEKWKESNQGILTAGAELAQRRTQASKQYNQLFDETYEPIANKYNACNTGDEQVPLQAAYDEALKQVKAAEKIYADIDASEEYKEYQKTLASKNSQIDAINAKDAEISKHEAEIQSVGAPVVKKIALRLLSLNAIDADDPIIRARFFFTWIAITIKYEAKKSIMDALTFREPVMTLRNGFEVCEGFAILFDALFNATLQDPLVSLSGVRNPKASHFVRGYVRKTMAQTGPNDTVRHRWNAFPLGNGQYKVIIPTPVWIR